MSTVIRCPDGRIKLYTKGADTVIYERLAQSSSELQEPTLVHLEDYATEGLRTLCLASRDISEEEYTQWSAMYDAAASQMSGRAEGLEKVAEVIEKDLTLLGATAIEDKLQDGVPDTIHTLQQAGIKVWVLTGDRQETAINIGLSCRLISESMNLLVVNEETSEATAEFLNKRLFAIKNHRNTGDSEELALVIGENLHIPSSLSFLLTSLKSMVRRRQKSDICTGKGDIKDIPRARHHVQSRHLLPGLSTSKSFDRQAGEEEPKGHSARHRRWCQ